MSQLAVKSGMLVVPEGGEEGELIAWVYAASGMTYDTGEQSVHLQPVAIPTTTGLHWIPPRIQLSIYASPLLIVFIFLLSSPFNPNASPPRRHGHNRSRWNQAIRTGYAIPKLYLKLNC